MTSSSDYPRPQLTRSRWTDLCGVWDFAFDDDARCRTPQDVTFDREIVVPYPPESELSGVRETGFHPVVWYRRTFAVTPDDRAGRLLLHFGAVDYAASVWVNGQLVARHEGGHTPFTADITDVLTSSETQTVVVRAEDDPRDLTQPRGKQDWEETPHAIWYHRTTGIWQPVWLEPVAHTHVTALRWTPDLDRTELRLHALLDGVPERGARLRVRLSLRGEELADATVRVTGRDAHVSLGLSFTSRYPERYDLLWSPRHPNLIDADVTLLVDDEVVDTVGSYAGMRSAAVADGHFLLNGSPYYPRLVLAQNFWPDSHLAAPSADALRREAELVKELGFNGVRVHQKIEDPRFLAWCDRLGLLVWGEMPSAYAFSERTQERLTAEWTEAVRRDYSHPCVVTWVPLNESWGVPNLERDHAQRDFVRALYFLTRALDPTRPVIGNDGWQFVAGDVMGVHDYALEPDAMLERYGTHDRVERTLREVRPQHRSLLMERRVRDGEPVMLTEFGGLSQAPSEGENWWGYGTAESAEALLGQYEALVGAVLACEAVTGFCYTQLTDTLQESNGLLRADRTPKLDVARLRAINTRPARSMPGDVISDIHAQADARSASERPAEDTTS